MTEYSNRPPPLAASPRFIELPAAPVTASPVPELTSIHSTKPRGPYGDARYRGNCGGYLIRDLLRYFGAKSVLDPMSGSGTCADVCRELAIACQTFDIRRGRDAADPASYAGLKPVDFVSVSTAHVAAVTVGLGSDNWSVTTKAGQTRIFVTSTTYNGAFGGLAAADAECQARAGVLGYSGSWKAILSNSTTNAKDRVTITYPIVRASDGTTVDATNIWDGSLANGVDAAGLFVWTGTNSDGNKNANTCSDWTSSSSGVNGIYGVVNATNTTWTIVTPGTCNNALRLYCVDQ